jgi:hypothetical protein
MRYSVEVLVFSRNGQSLSGDSYIRLLSALRNTEWLRSTKKKKKCSTTLIIREMQIKTILRFNLTAIRMAKIKNSGYSRC